MIRKNIREKGKKIADKNWVLTAYDELSADGNVSAIAPANQGQAARTTGKSRGKVTAKASKKQGKGKKKVTVEYDLESNTWKGIPKEANMVSTGKAERGIVEGFTNDPRIRAMHSTRTGKTWLRVDTFDNNAETPARINSVLEGEGYEIDVGGDSSGFVDFDNFEDAKRFADHVENVQEQVDAEREKLRLQKAEERYQRGVDGVKPSKAEVALRDAVIDKLRESGIEVLGVAEGQKVLDLANGNDVRLEAKRKEHLEPRPFLVTRNINQLSFQVLMVQRYSIILIHWPQNTIIFQIIRKHSLVMLQRHLGQSDMAAAASMLHLRQRTGRL